MDQSEIISEAIDASIRATQFGNIVLLLVVAAVVILIVSSRRRKSYERQPEPRELLAALERVEHRLDRLEQDRTDPDTERMDLRLDGKDSTKAALAARKN